MVRVRRSRRAPAWADHGQAWPHRHASRFIEAGHIVWHVQQMGEGPDLLLLHGTGAATHSWAGMMPLLAKRFRVTAPDLPGHGFTEDPGPSRMSLPAMAAAVNALAGALELKPQIVVGHSAGAAIACRMTLDGQLADARVIVGLNAALLPFPGIGRKLFPSLARVMFLNPFVPYWLSWQGRSQRRVRGLLESTGSRISDEMLSHYLTLMRDPAHVGGAVGMMAHWDLEALERDLAGLIKPPLVLIAALKDRTISPSTSERVAALSPAARAVTIGGLGHLAHEEAPGRIADLIVKEWQSVAAADA